MANNETNRAKNINELAARIDGLDEKIQRMLEQHFCKLKEMANRRSIEDEQSVSKCDNKSSSKLLPTKRSFLKRNSWVHPAPTEGKTALTDAIADASLTKTSTGISFGTRGIRDTKTCHEGLSTQYDNALQKIYLVEWPNAVPQFEGKHRCCCRRDLERDNDSRKMLKKIFPSYMFYLLTFAGAIPPQSKLLLCLVTGFWIGCCVFLGQIMLSGIIQFIIRLLCRLDENCQIPTDLKFGLTTLVSLLFFFFLAFLSIVLVHTSLRDLLQSRELRTLISSIGLHRIRALQRDWIVLIVLIGLVTVASCTLTNGNGTSAYPAVRILAQIYSSVVNFAILTFFALVTRAICLCYDDWAAQMLATTATKSPQPSVELKLLDMLKARVALCALVTRKTRVLLLPSMIAVVSLFWSFLEALIDPRRAAVMDLVDRLLNVACIQGLPLLLALYVSSRISILENLVAQANLRIISEYLVYAPKEWMLGQKLALSTELLVKAGSAVTLLFAFCTMYVTANQQAIVIPWDKPYRHFGSCADGFHSGLEQHIDCGPPDSGCPKTCQEKYGAYILIPGNRDCTEVDGYVHITTQRACTTAYNTWARSNNRSSGNNRAIVYQGAPVHSPSPTRVLTRYLRATYGLFTAGEWKHAEWSGGFRCGAYLIPTFRTADEEIDRFSFPAMFSSSIIGDQKPQAYLCYAGTLACKAKVYSRDSTPFEEMMACPGPAPQSQRFTSVWRNISSPLPTLVPRGQHGNNVAEFRSNRGRDGDCCEIQLDSSAHVGAQVVFTLACNWSAYVGPSARAEPDSICPQENHVRLTVNSKYITRGSLFVSPTVNMTSAVEYDLEESASQNIIVNSSSTFTLIVDHSSDLRSVKLCV